MATVESGDPLHAVNLPEGNGVRLSPTLDLNGVIPFPLPSPAVSHILCEFLEVAFHMILYVREIYPPCTLPQAWYSYYDHRFYI